MAKNIQKKPHGGLQTYDQKKRQIKNLKEPHTFLSGGLQTYEEKKRSIKNLKDDNDSFFKNTADSRKGPLPLLFRFKKENDENLDWLKADFTIDSEKDLVLISASNYIGAIPLRSPITGLPVLDFFVYPKFLIKDSANILDEYQNLVSIIQKIGIELNIERSSKLKLIRPSIFKPPLFYEAINYIEAYSKFISRPWRRFERVDLCSEKIIGNIDWTKYSNNYPYPGKRTIFDQKVNRQTVNHSENQKLKYVFNLCVEELSKISTPRQLLNQNQAKIQSSTLLSHSIGVTPATSILVRSSDTPDIAAIKSKANNFLSHFSIDSMAWRMDTNELFERFVQFMFREATKRIGWSFIPNPKIWGSNTQENDLRYLEPDGIIENSNGELIIIDAKNKFHLYTRGEKEEMKLKIRADLHQILAYSSFDESKTKTVILCYPAFSKASDDKILHFDNKLSYRYGNVDININKLGFVIEESKMNKQIEELYKHLLSIKVI